ncbi:unnamed protein product [Thelazia callipaeda]|uniref:Abhydrolase_3 domain-containing protein n=1 Tax=Thelazia callipaeda TaxID=103827 RepID=A0A0N5D5N3_THECL|nr:unnamed protein product [Thelazia callipaeda]
MLDPPIYIKNMSILSFSNNDMQGEIVYFIFGPIWRNSLTRLLYCLPSIFYLYRPNSLTIRTEFINNVRVRVYYPKKRRSNALILYFHGGGWATLRPFNYDVLMFYFIRRLGILVISVDYRRSPEYHYPIPIHDCEAVYQEIVMIDYKRYGIDRNQIIVMGDSAGGNLATVIAQRQLRKNFPQPLCQILIYPVIHPFDFQSPSYQKYYKYFPGCMFLCPRVMVEWYLLYLGIPATRNNIHKMLRNQHIRRSSKLNEEIQSKIGHNLLPTDFISDSDKKSLPESEDDYLCEAMEKYVNDPNLAPIMATKLEGLSPTMIVTTEYDILRDEAVLYAKHLKSFNVSVHWKHYQKAYHGILNMPISRRKLDILRDVAAFIDLQLSKVEL